jgi:glycosyltransferase involved in cell wall biosynthesis
MPVFNGAKYIGDALESLLGQTFTNFELIISDNHSTDSTRNICETYAKRDSRIKYIRQSKNLGSTANFKFVLDQSRAGLFMWAAHDDTWSSNFIEDAVDLLNNNNQVDYIFPTFELRSIRLGIAKKINREVFEFISHPDRRTRVLTFLSTHPLSHSANIVYSVFRTNFIRSVYEKQDIGNDGLMATFIVASGLGVQSNSLFSKRYETKWPGFLPPFIHNIKACLGRRATKSRHSHAIQLARDRALDLFPEYTEEIRLIYENIYPNHYDRLYRAVPSHIFRIKA